MSVTPGHDASWSAIGEESLETLGARLRRLHDRLLEIAPGIDRIACAIYDPEDDCLATFINSTHSGTAISGYRFPLSQSPSLSALAASGQSRVLTDLQTVLAPTVEHSKYVLDQGYQSSLTFPMRHQGELLGFLFFDSHENDTFTVPLQRELALHATVMTMALASELMTVRTLVGTLQVARDFAQLRDLETGAHLERMSQYAKLIAQQLATPLGLTDEYVAHVYLYAPLHDIGKIGIPDRVLLKQGPLDDEEWAIMRTHPTLGRAMVEDITRDLGLGTLPFDAMLRNIVELHHEKLDGSGYPHGLKGDAVPMESRIISVADVFDALTSPRPYKDAWTNDQAFAELEAEAKRGTLDAMAVQSLIDKVDAVTAIQARHAEVWTT